MSKSRFRVPHTLVLLFSMIILAYGLTLIVQPGAYARKQVTKKGGHDVIQCPRSGLYLAVDDPATVSLEAGTYIANLDDSSAESVRLGATRYTLQDDGSVTFRVYSEDAYFRQDPDEGAVATKTVVAPGTYEMAEDPKTLPVWSIFTLIPKGFAKGSAIIVFIFIVGGAFGVLRATGAVDGLLGWSLARFAHRPAWLVAGGMALFCAGSSTIGMAEEYIPFVPLLVALCVAVGFDAITAVGILCIGYSIGYGVALVNPFTVLVAQNIAGLDETSGWAFRLALTLPFLALGFHHVYSYARRVQKNPQASYVADIERPTGTDPNETTAFTKIHGVVLALLGLGIAVFIYGIQRYGWYLDEMGALFLILTVLFAVVARLSPDKTAREFCTGATELTTTALLIGFAYTIEVVLNEGGIIDSIIHGLAQPLETLPASLSAIGMFLVQSVCNFAIPSGSGQAYVTMPLMAPLSDLVDVPRQTAVLAYQFGDGFTNILVPTNAVLVGILTMARIPYERWLRFVFPFMIKMWIAGSLALAIAVMIGYGR